MKKRRRFTLHAVASAQLVCARPCVIPTGRTGPTASWRSKGLRRGYLILRLWRRFSTLLCGNAPARHRSRRLHQIGPSALSSPMTRWLFTSWQRVYHQTPLRGPSGNTFHSSGSNARRLPPLSPRHHRQRRALRWRSQRSVRRPCTARPPSRRRSMGRSTGVRRGRPPPF